MCEHCGVDDCLGCASLEEALLEDEKLWKKPAWVWKEDEVCSCTDWDEMVEELYITAVCSALLGIEPLSKPFKYCPWCGKPRRKEKE